MWDALSTVSALIVLAALIGVVVGLVRAIMRKWGLLACSTVVVIVGFALFVFSEGKANPTGETQHASISDNISATVRSLPAAPAPTMSSASARASNASDDLNDCKDRFRNRKSFVISLHSDGLLDAYGLSDIGVLNNYGISVDAAVAVSDILYANGLYGLQNHYDEVVYAICAEVRHDERLIREGTREAFVNR